MNFTHYDLGNLGKGRMGYVCRIDNSYYNSAIR